MRRIRVKANLIKGSGAFNLEIMEQTHFRGEFGGSQYPDIEDDANLQHSFLASNGVLLVSYWTPAFEVREGNPDWTHKDPVFAIVRLVDPDYSKRHIFGIQERWWPRIKQAVEEYNEFYRDK